MAKSPEKQESQLANGDGRVPVEVGPLADAGAEAGRADERAVRAGEAAVRDLRPAGRLELRQQPPAETVDRDRIADRPAHARHARSASLGPLNAGRLERQALGERPPGLRAGPDDEPVVELRQDEVRVVAAHLGAGAHRRAEARGRRHAAFDRDDEGGVAPGHVVRVGDRSFGEHPILDAQRRQFAAAHAEEGERRRIRLDRLEESPSVPRSARPIATRDGKV